MRFGWVTVMVNDLEESIKFYQDIIGLAVSKRYIPRPGVEIAFMDSGETQIELMRDENVEKGTIGQDICLGFEVSSLDETLALIKARGASIHSGPIQPAPHIKFFYILDPNGVKIQFAEHLQN